MSLMERVSNKTSYTVAIGISILFFAGLVTVLGLPIVYYFVRDNNMEIFLLLIKILSILDPIVLTMHLLVLGLVRPCTWKSLRPINDNIIGEDYSSSITINQLDKTLKALKAFPRLNATFAGVAASVACLPSLGIVYWREYDIIVVACLGGIAMLVIGGYTFFNFWYTDTKTSLMIRKGHRLVRNLKIDQDLRKKKKRF